LSKHRTLAAGVSAASGGASALSAAIVLTALGLFGLGMLKGALSHRGRWRTGAQLLVLASAAGVAGYVIGVAARSVFGLAT
jgi:VIT1/CCC1 family predicted Fe2+/Mn2+ transporter